MNEQILTVTGAVYSTTEAFEKLKRYPWKTPLAFDLQGRGELGVLTMEEVVRTRTVSSRMSHAQAALFVSAADTAPWVDAAADLSDADPQTTGGLFDAMTNLY
jgi:carbohydrate-selective porin OprB